MNVDPNRRVITFYSFKGGVGRTMTVANVAWRLANKHGLKVIAVDFDLEAPGLERFFGVSREEAAAHDGVLDFLLAWQSAVAEKALAAPAVRGSLIPIRRAPFVPKFGAISVLLAGRQDRDYCERLRSFDWKAFYQTSQGAMAIETLRQQLVNSADLILVDSRTGLTDTGGICTVQLPDGVVLMSAPNEQSLEGVEAVAQVIRNAQAGLRAHRGKPKIWFSLARVSKIEEQKLAQEWVEQHRPWFDRCITNGLWNKDDHPRGIASWEIPHRGRYGFGEKVVDPSFGDDPGDYLAIAFDKLGEQLSAWSSGSSVTVFSSPQGLRRALAEPDVIEARVRDAERRGDIAALMLLLYELGQSLLNRKRLEDSELALRRAADLALAHGTKEALGTILYALGCVKLHRQRPDEAGPHLERALLLSKESGNLANEARAWIQLGRLSVQQRNLEEALSAFERGLDLARHVGDGADEGSATLEIGQVRLLQHRFDEALDSFGRARTLAAQLEYREVEAFCLLQMGMAYFAYEPRPRLEDALEMYRGALEISSEVDKDDLRAHALLGVSQVQRALGQSQIAEQALGEARDAAVEAGDTDLAKACEAELLKARRDKEP